MEKITLKHIIDFLMFFYILSLYTFTFQLGWNVISNLIALVLIILIWLENLILRRKIVFNIFLFVYVLFIIICLISCLYAIDPIASINKVQTLVLNYILMFSLVNYINTFKKLEYFIKCFVYSGFIVSIYIIISGDFTVLERFGSNLGNVNEIGMIICVSTVFSLYKFLSTKKYWYILIILTNLTVIFLTGSRKALIFVVVSVLVLLVFQENSNKIKNKFKYFIISIVVIILVFYIVYNVPIFYEILGKRMIYMLNFISGEGASDASMTERFYMLLLGWNWFKASPLLGYGIDSYKFLYNSVAGGRLTYSHNNLIELLIGTGVVGTTLFYLANIIVLKDLFKAAKIFAKTACFTFITIIAGYILLSVGMVYYSDKHISIILAVGSVIYNIVQIEKLR